MVVSTGLMKSVLELFHADRLTMPVNERLLLNLPDLPVNKGEAGGSGKKWHKLSPPLYSRSVMAWGEMSAPPAGSVFPGALAFMLHHCSSLGLLSLGYLRHSPAASPGTQELCSFTHLRLAVTAVQSLQHIGVFGTTDYGYGKKGQVKPRKEGKKEGGATKWKKIFKIIMLNSYRHFLESYNFFFCFVLTLHCSFGP